MMLIPNASMSTHGTGRACELMSSNPKQKPEDSGKPSNIRLALFILAVIAIGAGIYCLKYFKTSGAELPKYGKSWKSSAETALSDHNKSIK
jgi:hypothetical protein